MGLQNHASGIVRSRRDLVCQLRADDGETATSKDLMTEEMIEEGKVEIIFTKSRQQVHTLYAMLEYVRD